MTPPRPETFAKMDQLIKHWRSKGILIQTGGRMPEMLEMIIARKGGKSAITDGPFTESKEMVGGFALYNVKDRAEVTELTNQFLDLVGGGTVELYEVGLV